MITISNSNGITLVFKSQELYEAYQAAHDKVAMEFYGKIRRQYGIWASNQNKFVSSEEELNRFDSRASENAYKEYSGRA